MRIPMKKDFEEAYRDEFFQGFTLRETIYIVISVIIAIAVTVGIWRFTGLPPDVCVYIGVPCAVPTLIVGFVKFQGLTVGAYLKEILYERRTRLLLYDADEISENANIFTIEKKQNESSRKRRRRQSRK